MKNIDRGNAQVSRERNTPLILSWENMHEAVESLAAMIEKSKYGYEGVYGIPRGGLPLAVALSHRLKTPLHIARREKLIVVDDIIDSGKSMSVYRPLSPLPVAWAVREERAEEFPLHAITVNDNIWVIFPWETIEEWKQKAAR